jgi:hypothetical protein
MVAPTDYGVQIADPTQSFLSAFQAGAGIQEARLKQEQQTQQAAQQKLIQEGFTKLRSPNATTEDVSNLAMILPKDQSESVLKAWALKTDVQKQNSLSQAGKVVSALFAGENEIAQQYINDQAVATRNSGNEEGAKFLETWRGVTEINPAASRDFFTSQLLQLPGGKEIVENIIKLGAEKRAAGKAPSELLEAQSKAKKAESEANVSVATATDDIARAKALRELEQAKARREAAEADVAQGTVQSRQDLATAQLEKEQALTAASVGGESRAAGLAESVLEKSVADAAAAVADAEKKVSEAKDTPARLEAEQALRVAQAEQQRALTAASVGGETRAAEKAPSELIETRAKAEKARIESKYAEKIKIQELEKQAADLGLTKAQTNSAIATTKKLGQETAKIVIELAALKANNGLDPAKAFDQEEKLRREYQSRTKAYGELGTIYSNIEASANAKTGPGDIALITGFQKMLDPGSVVRETEFATSRDTAGVVQRLLNESQKLQSGQLFALDSKQRQEYVNLAKQYLEAAQKKAVEDKKALGVVVKNYRLNPDNVFGTEPTAAAPLPVSATIGGRTYARPANFTDAQWRDYLKANGVIQ